MNELFFVKDAKSKADDGKDDKYEEKYLCNIYSSSSNAPKAKNGSNQSNNEEDYSVAKHGFISPGLFVNICQNS